MRWGHIVNVLIGAWNIAAPFLLGFSDRAAATWASILIGLIQVALHLLAMYSNNPQLRRWAEQFNNFVGIWWIIHPFVFGLSGISTVLTAYLLSGVITIAVSFARGRALGT